MLLLQIIYQGWVIVLLQRLPVGITDRFPWGVGRVVCLFLKI